MFFEITKIMVDGDAGNGCIVDHGKPLFSWAAEHEENGAAQSAYRITVRNGNNIKWNTGWVESHKQSAQYAGMPLEAGAELEWTVTIRDEQGRQTQPKSGMFRTGLMGEWDAGWITTPWDHEGETKCFRKTFILKDAVQKANMYICGLGYQYITINGIEVDTARLQPAVSNYAKQCYYIILPVQEFLKTGENVLEVTIGEGWRRNRGAYLKYIPNREIAFFGIPKLTAQLIMDFSDGSVQNIKTDESWLCGCGPVVFSNLFDGETFDERVQTKFTQNAVIVSEPPRR